MRVLIVMALFLSFSAFAQSVKENIKQQTVVTGSQVPVDDFEVTPEPSPSQAKKKAKK